MKRVAMIGGRGFPAREGGVEHVIDLAARQLARRGWEVLVYGRGHYLAQPCETPGVRSLVTGGLSGKHLDTFTHTATACLDVLRRDVDVVHMHSPGPALLSWLPRLAARPTVLTIHAPDWRRARWSWPARLALQGGLRVGMRCADVVTAVAPHLVEELTARFHRPVTLTPNPAVAVEPPPAERLDPLGLTAGRYVLTVGRLVPEKRLGLLIDAWARADLDTTLVVVGASGDDAYARRCRRAAPPSVRFIGPQFGTTLQALYAHAAMLVHPSGLEGASLVLLEAAAAGCPVLCCDIPANRDLLGEAAGYLPADVGSAELADELSRWYSMMDQRERIGRQGRRRVLDCFDLSTCVDRLEDVYRRTIEPTGSCT